MNERDFCYWLQGYLEISGNKELSVDQVTIVQDHLKLVFTKQTPTYSYQEGTAGSQQGLLGLVSGPLGPLVTC